MNSFKDIEKALKKVSITQIPALLAVIIKRCATEPIFKGWFATLDLMVDDIDLRK